MPSRVESSRVDVDVSSTVRNRLRQTKQHGEQGKQRGETKGNKGESVGKDIGTRRMGTKARQQDADPAGIDEADVTDRFGRHFEF